MAGSQEPTFLLRTALGEYGQPPLAATTGLSSLLMAIAQAAISAAVAHDCIAAVGCKSTLARIHAKITPQLACCREPFLEGACVDGPGLMHNGVSEPSQ